MAGINSDTGHVLDGFDHVQQSIEKILFTRQGERVMREWFGNPGLKLLGENATQRTILQWFNITWMLLELFEPRFRIKLFEVGDVNRLGYADFTMHGEYRPFAHLDFVQAKAYVSIEDQVVTIEGGG